MNIFQTLHPTMNLSHCDGPGTPGQRSQWVKTGLWGRFVSAREPVDEVEVIAKLSKALGIKFKGQGR